ncbi:MAG TPA: AlbA family DNA-binding domain-containing protein [Candidatus Wunengus sp. YC61]|uniref:AlbA family DNA-binding domain-containing protein n=1 Tax=Candidatus Wunengus sp. YC61 TaxID=3367698 RepID=UPI00402A43F8
MGRAEDIFEKIKKDGEQAIDEFIIDRQSEELFLEFKRSADNGSGSKLNDNDRVHLAKAISGFGNSEGGVIVWGIDCSKDKDHADVAHTKCPIQNTKRFVSWLEGVVSGCTVPPHTKVQHYDVIDGKTGNGFVVTLIPKSNYAPHQVVAHGVHGKSQYHYYIRAGSNFEHTPHAVLAGMFGRRPQPDVYPNYSILQAEIIDERIRLQINFTIRNKGPGVASDLFMNVMVISIPGSNCDCSCEARESQWISQITKGINRGQIIVNVISASTLRLAPEAFYTPISILLDIAPPFTEKLIIDGNCGCGQSPSYKFRIENDSKTIEKLYDDFVEKNRKCTLTVEEKHNLAINLLNIKNNES